MKLLVQMMIPCVTTLLLAVSSAAFSPLQTPKLSSALKSINRRNFGESLVAASTLLVLPQVSNAQVYLDPAMYGDQELRVSTVDTIRERSRRAILQDPTLAPSFYQLALLDGISYNAATQQFGPNGSIIRAVLNSKATDEYTLKLKAACDCLLDATLALKKKTAVTLADAVAIAGAEAIESIGGPVLPVQLGRTDYNKNDPISPLPIDILNGQYSNTEVVAAFNKAGLTEREMTALLGGLLILETVQKSRTTEDWKASVKPKFVERGKLGRMSDYKRLSDEDIAMMEDDYLEDPDDGWYIVDSFGTRDQRFGDRIAKDEITEKTFNKYLKDLDKSAKKGTPNSFGWIGNLILDTNYPTQQAWLNKYAQSNLNYIKDLSIAFNSVTQLGGVYTGGKYENLLKNKPRKSLNDDDLKLF